MACQNFTVSKSNTYLNYISLYLYNFTVPAASYTHGSPTNRITITISNSTSHNFIEVGYTVNNTGWNQIFLSKSGHYNLGKGNYTLKVNGTGYSRNIIGWGFSTTGGYDNYLKEDASNALDQSLNIAKYSSITAYSNGLLTEASNQVFLFSLGYFNISESNLLLTKNITFNHSANGEILSNGFTQFTYQAIYAIQDGASLEASAGVTFATVNPLPIQLIGTKNNLAFSSYIYSMNIIKGIPTSISGDGSTILSISLANRTSLNYTVGNSYFFGGATQSIYGKVVNINLTAFSYSITSNFAKYWMDSFYTQLPVNTADKSNSHYNITVGGYNYFNVVLNNDQLYFSLNQSLMSLSQFSKGIPIYSISNLYQSYLVTQV